MGVEVALSSNEVFMGMTGVWDLLSKGRSEHIEEEVVVIDKISGKSLSCPMFPKLKGES